MNKKLTPKQIRNMAGLTQVDIAEKLGLSTTTYVLKEMGKSRFYFDEIKKMCEICNFPIDQVEI